MREEYAGSGQKESSKVTKGKWANNPQYEFVWIFFFLIWNHAQEGRLVQVISGLKGHQDEEDQSTHTHTQCMNTDASGVGSQWTSKKVEPVDLPDVSKEDRLPLG